MDRGRDGSLHQPPGAANRTRAVGRKLPPGRTVRPGGSQPGVLGSFRTGNGLKAGDALHFPAYQLKILPDRLTPPHSLEAARRCRFFPWMEHRGPLTLGIAPS